MGRYPQNHPQNSAFLWMNLWMEDNSLLRATRLYGFWCEVYDEPIYARNKGRFLHRDRGWKKYLQYDLILLQFKSRWRKCLSDIWHVYSYPLMSDFSALPIFVEGTVRRWQECIRILESQLSVSRRCVCHAMTCWISIYAICVMGGRYVLSRSVLLICRN